MTIYYRIVCAMVLISSGHLNADIEEYFNSYSTHHRFSGVVYINAAGSDGGKLLTGGISSEAIPQSHLLRFNIGSITKQFTAAAVLSLRERGLLRLDAPINNYLGTYADKKWENITVHHLMTHTSGIPSVYQTEQGLPLFMPEERQTSLSEMIGRFSHGELLFSPGSEFSYSNSGYILLAAIIEQLTDKSYFAFMQQDVFDKHGLRNTSFQLDDNTALPKFGYHPMFNQKLLFIIQPGRMELETSIQIFMTYESGWISC